MTRSALKDDAIHPNASFGDRFRAWWHGEELPPAKRDLSSVALQRKPANAALRVLDRPALLQEIWGEGFSSWNDRDLLLNLLNSLAVDKSSSVIELGAGLGGTLRFMAEHYGCWALGLEASDALVQSGIKISSRLGLATKAELRRFDIEKDPLRRNAADGIVAFDYFSKLRDKEAALEKVKTSLKSRGRFVVVDFFLKDQRKAKTLGLWPTKEDNPPHFWPVKQLIGYLKNSGFDLHVNEDIALPVRRAVERNWSRFATDENLKTFSLSTIALAMKEAEYWANRMRAVDQGLLEIRRLTVIKKHAGTLTMSDW